MEPSMGFKSIVPGGVAKENVSCHQYTRLMSPR